MNKENLRCPKLTCSNHLWKYYVGNLPKNKINLIGLPNINEEIGRNNEDNEEEIRENDLLYSTYIDDDNDDGNKNEYLSISENQSVSVSMDTESNGEVFDQIYFDKFSIHGNIESFSR